MQRIIFALAMLVIFSFALVAHSQDRTKKSPNILMICIDDLNDFLGCTGNIDAITPNIDRLALNGTLFTNAHCQAPLCGPSRASILTGLRPSSTGIYGMINDDDLQQANDRTRSTVFLHQYFKNAGYYLMGVGKIFHQHAPQGLLDESGGGSKYGPALAKRKNWDKKGTATDWAAYPERDDQMPDDAAVKWAVDRLNKDYDKPFFLSVGFIRPHVPWYVPQKWFDLYDPAKLRLPPFLKNDLADLPPISAQVNSFSPMPTTEWAIETNQWRDIIQAYLACVSYTDNNVGTVMKALQESDHANNTIVVLWSDHGYRLGEKNTFAKQCLWDRATKAPLIFYGPGIPKNQKIDQPVELLSLYPTLTDLSGLPRNPQNEGPSLETFFRNPNAKWNHHALTTWGRNNHAIKTKDYRYIHYEDGAEELYAIKTDPNEWHNLAGDAKYTKKIQELKKLLPAINEKWAKASAYDATEYLKNQKATQGME